MNTITFSEAQRLSSPNPFCLISTCNADYKDNLMALSWWTYCSNRPPTIAICMSQKAYSNALIKESKEFALNIVDSSLQHVAFQCGVTSGRNADKAIDLGIDLLPSQVITPKLVTQSRVAFECQLIEIVPINDHDMFIANVVAVHGCESKDALYAIEGYRALSTVKIKKE